MKFKRIDEHTVHCFLTKADLEHYDMTVEDFIKNPEKTNDFIHKIVMLSLKETDFAPGTGTIQCQIVPAGDSGMLLMMIESGTEQKPTDNLWQQLRRRLRQSIESLAAMKEEDAEEKDTESGETPSVQDMMTAMFAGEDEPEEEAPEAGAERCYMFATYEDLMNYVRSLEGKTPELSQLYYQDRAYFLIFSSEMMAKADFDYLCRKAEEYGYLTADADSRIMLIREHTDPLLAKDAVKTLLQTL